MAKDGCIVSGGITYLIFWIYIGIAWIINLIQAIQLFMANDPETMRTLIVKVVGIVIAPASGITVWF